MSAHGNRNANNNAYVSHVLPTSIAIRKNMYLVSYVGWY